MSSTEEKRKYIAKTQIGVMTVTEYDVTDYDVDDMASDRTEAHLIGLHVKNIAATIDPYATKNDLIKSSEVEDVNA
jgi:hypothetical protein